MILLDHRKELAEDASPTLAGGSRHRAAVADRLHRVAASEGVTELVKRDQDIDDILSHWFGVAVTSAEAAAAAAVA